jgi:hypothetical protein
VHRTGRQALLYDKVFSGQCDALHGILWCYLLAHDHSQLSPGYAQFLGDALHRVKHALHMFIEGFA